MKLIIDDMGRFPTVISRRLGAPAGAAACIPYNGLLIDMTALQPGREASLAADTA